MSTITSYANDLERDLLLAHQLLNEGLEEALKRFQQSAAHMSEQLKSLETFELQAVGKYTHEVVNVIEHQLGILNYLEAEGDIDSLEEFDKLTQPLSDSLDQACRALLLEEKACDALLGHQSDELARAWQELRIHIELARIHLTLDAIESEDILPELRQQLGASLQVAARKANNHHRSRSIVATAFSEIRQLSKVARRAVHVLFDGTADQPKDASSPETLD